MGKSLFGGGGGASTPIFIPPPAPPPAANPATMADARVQGAAAMDTTKKTGRGAGFGGTDKTSGAGIGAPPPVSKPTLGG